MTHARSSGGKCELTMRLHDCGHTRTGSAPARLDLACCVWSLHTAEPFCVSIITDAQWLRGKLAMWRSMNV